jgi:hypothetical protein
LLAVASRSKGVLRAADEAMLTRPVLQAGEDHESEQLCVHMFQCIEDSYVCNLSTRAAGRAPFKSTKHTTTTARLYSYEPHFTCVCKKHFGSPQPA